MSVPNELCVRKCTLVRKKSSQMENCIGLVKAPIRVVRSLLNGKAPSDCSERVVQKHNECAEQRFCTIDVHRQDKMGYPFENHIAEDSAHW